MFLRGLYFSGVSQDLCVLILIFTGKGGQLKKMVMGESAGGDVYGIGQHMLTNGKVCYSKIQLSSEEVVST